MAKIYKRTDRLTVKIDDLIVKLAPLALAEKTEVQDMMARGTITKDYKLLQSAISKAIQYSLKEIEGVEDADGVPYKLSFDESGHLTTECVDDLYNLESHPKLVLVCSRMANSIPSQFTDNRGNPLEGVEILTKKKDETPDPN